MQSPPLSMPQGGRRRTLTDLPAYRTTGADLIEPVCALAAKQSAPIYLFGTDSETLALSTAYLTARIPSLKIADAKAPAYGFDPTSADAEHYAKEIAASGAPICFVALGAPKQELFVQHCRTYCPKVGFFCIGASLDYLAGKQRRAPAIIQTLGFEWAWRWICAPRRLTRRYLRALPKRS